MSYYIVIRGPLGIGKSTIAKLLAKLLNAEYISIDDVLAEHRLDKVDKEEGYIPARNFVKASELVIPEVKEKLAGNKIVIFDGNFYHKEQIEHLVKNLSGQHYSFTLKAPLDVCIDRDSKRKKPYGPDATSAVYAAVARFDYGTIIDTNKKTASQVVKEILTYLPVR